MDAALFTKMLSDKSVLDLKKLGYKYPQADMGEFVSLLKNGFYHPLPLKDFPGQELVYLDSVAQVHLSAARILLTPQSSTQLYGAKAMEEEIISTFTIEQVDFSRDSVRKILSGFAPADESENRIYGMKKGLEFISDPPTGSPKHLSISCMRLPSVPICRRKTVCTPAASTGTTVCTWSAPRWSTPDCRGSSCRSAWANWCASSMRIPTATTC